MAIVAASRSWKETRDVMMTKYLAAEKMATEAHLAAVQRKNFSTYNDFLREFTLVALRIPGVTDRIMSKYFLRQFSEFDKDKILSAYQQTSKFVNTRDVDFSTVTDLAEKTVVTETLALLKEGEVIDLTGRTGDKVKKEIESLHERASPRLLKGLRQLLTRRRVEIDEDPEAPEEEREEEAPQVANLQRSRGDLEDLEKAFAGILKAGVWESIWSFQRMTVMKEMDHDIILGRPWYANVEMIGMHLHDGSYMVDIEDPVTGRGELLRLLGTGGDPPKEKLATWSPSFKDGTRKGAFARMEGMRERLEIMIEEAFNKKEWIKMGLPQKKRRQEDEVLGVMVAGKESEVELGASLPKRKEVRMDVPEVALEIPDLLQLIKALRYHKEKAMEKEEEVLRVIQERRATEGHQIPDEVADTMKIGVEGFLTEEEDRLIKRTWQEFHLAFAFSDHQKGRLHAKLIPPVRIHTVEHECWNDKGPSYELRIAGEVTDLLRAKIDSFIAEPTASPYANRWFVFRKPNKTLRWIQDLQKLNAVTIRDAGSLPQADLLAESHAGRSIYSLIDLYSGDDQLPLDVRDRPYTAMHTPVGQLQMQVTPMGFTNTVAEAQHRMLVVAGDMFPEKCEPYIDDNPIKGAQEKDETEVQPGIRRRFILRIDPTNVAGVLKNYRPIDPTVGRWVGFIWQFDYKIERIVGIRNKADGLSRVCITPEGVEDAEPIDAFLEFEGGTLAVDNEMMGEECASGELLIRTLEKGAPAVVAELREGPVTTRGRKEERDSWGAIAGPKEELIAMPVEGGREAVMSLVESWEKKELQWTVNQMQERKDEDHEGKEFFYAQIYEGIFREIELLLVGNKQPTEVSTRAREEAERYVLRGGHLFRREEGAMPRRVVCERYRQLDVIQAMHDGLAGGHRSSKGTLAKLAPLYYWPGMASMVAIYCQTCLICQERSSARVFEPLRLTRVLGPGHLVHLDLAVMPVSTDGYRYILDARDNLSGFVEAVTLKKKKWRSVADWIEDFYLRHPFVRRFIADNGTEFVNQEVLGMLKRLCVPIKLIEPYHPEANAPVERGHRTLKNTIAKLAADHLGSWPRYLKQAVFSENVIPKRTTGCILAELWYEREIDFPVEALIPTWNKLHDDPRITTEESIEARCQQVLKNEEVMKDIANRVLDSRMRDKARWDQVKNVRQEPLQVGETVLPRNSALESTWSGQLGRRFKGPYRVAKRVGLNTFELEDLDGNPGATIGQVSKSRPSGIMASGGRTEGQQDLEEKREKAKMDFGNKNDSGGINRPTGGEQARPSQGRRTAKRKLYIGLMGRPVVGRGGKKCVRRRPSPLRKGEGIEISSDSEGEKEKANVEKGGNADMGDKAQASDEEGANRGQRRETWHRESEGGQDMHDEREDGEERRESPLEGRSGHSSCEGYGTRTKIPYTYDPKNLTGGYTPIQTEDEEDVEEDVQEIIEISSGDERDEISRPREERRASMHQPHDEAFRWEDEFGPTPSHWFHQWTNVIRHE
ncbi:hypothetical protein CBR_g50858 [Chara braunii]|uniref:Integrase catalytic domain-containing protein n=1 Tax=Chara braunii TaxID=69332 RepID=A0A388M7F5_CHABU|nr:hypothetical protein CBR_g50858 [Chara braunii]|eukprot:GBG90514.1 hypothetical protein CBR_g50858 [Chara braunii]